MANSTRAHLDPAHERGVDAWAALVPRSSERVGCVLVGAPPGDRHALHGGVLLSLDQCLRLLFSGFSPGKMKETFGNKKMKKTKKRPLLLLSSVCSITRHACDMCTS